jgi:hypothetical protein
MGKKGRGRREEGSERTREGERIKGMEEEEEELDGREKEEREGKK